MAGGSYAVPFAVPWCFVLPRVHERQFPALVAWLHAACPARSDGPFDVFDLGGRDLTGLAHAVVHPSREPPATERR
jgi:hypothetical protein